MRYPSFCIKCKKRLFILIIIFISCNHIESAGALNIQNISIPEGLSNAGVTDILQDRYGFLWVSTEDGLNRYDGYSFKVFKNVPGNDESLIANNIWALKEDQHGNIWLATEEGVSCYHRTSGKFRNYDFEKLMPDRDESIPQIVSIFIDSREDIWVGSGGYGPFKYDRTNDRFVAIPILNDTGDLSTGPSISYPFSDIKGRLFHGNLKYGFLEYDPDAQLFKPVDFTIDGDKPDFTNFNEEISHLYADPTDQLWLISEFSVYKYNPRASNLKRIHTYPAKLNEVFWRYFTGVTLDFDGNLWIGKDGRGLFKHDGISDEFKQIPFGTEYDRKPNTYDKQIRAMLTDKSGIIWIGTMLEGLFKYDPSSEPFTHYSYDAENPQSISGDEAFGLHESKVYKNRIYVGLRGAGLDLFNSETGQFKPVKVEFGTDMFGGSVRAILEDDEGALYLGSWGGGLLKHDFSKGTRLISKYDSTRYNSLSDNLVRILVKDRNGVLWIGTNNGLNTYDPLRNEVKRINHEGQVTYPQELIDFVREKHNTGNSIASLLRITDHQDTTARFSIEKPRDFLILSAGEAVTNEPSVDFGWLEDQSGDTLWSGRAYQNTYYLGGNRKNRISAGLLKLKPGQYQLRYRSDDSHAYGKWNTDQPIDSTWWGAVIFQLNKKETKKVASYLREAEEQPVISGPNIRSIHISRTNPDLIWIGTDANGLNRYNQNNGQIKVFKYDSKNPNTVSNNSIQFIHEDADGILWLATNSGLNRFDPEKETFKVYREEDGLPTNYIASILEDDYGDLWIATRNGLSRMSRGNERVTFVNYDAKDGLGGSDYIAQVALKASNGKMYFGGEHGLNEFVPGQMNQNPPAIVITDLKIGNRSVLGMEEDSPIDSTLFEVKEIVLPHYRNDLSFEFSALHFGRAEKNQYAHILEGYDKDWVYDNRRFATYTNLDHGTYTFRARGSNSDGAWNNEGKGIYITILPPWWQTIWAYIGYGLLFLGIIFGIDRIQRRRLLVKERERQRIRESELRAEAAELKAKASEAEKRMLEVENERKSKELEEARQLQLSMLPKNLPQLPNLDIAVYMQTATEVGGDYYDFHVGLDGTLTVVIGDATGHGMKAGTIVTASKSLFSTHAANPDILSTFQEMTRCLKQMDLHLMSMCMTIMKIQNNQLTLSSAGMPPALLHRSGNGHVEELMAKGMPLGTFDDFPYELKDTTLNPGDTILLMSDGLPELFNDNKEMFGYNRILDIFKSAAEKPAEDIITDLKSAGNQWTHYNDPQDDVTFVVIKLK